MMQSQLFLSRINTQSVLIPGGSHSYIINNQAQIPTSVGQRPLDIFLVQKSVRHKLYK